MSDSRLDYLFGKYFDKTATPEERAEFMGLVAQSKSDGPLVKLMETTYTADQSRMEFSPEIKEKILLNIYQADEKQVSVHKIRWFSQAWIRYAAVLLLGMLGMAWYFYANEQQVLQIAHTKDIAPGGNKAVLTLGNGKKIVLDAAANGVLARQGKISITKTSDGKLVYQVLDDKSGSVGLNTIETPNGGQYQVNLPDGTKVWLNAASSLVYPTAFTGTERRVILKGEAYFEVAKNATKPFKVRLNNNSEIKVLGTHFNVNAYPDETTMNTTLMEGSVLVRSGSFTEKLAPGQQAQVNAVSHRLALVPSANLAEVLAWKDGLFSTDEISLTGLMRQVEKWYGVNVVYKDNVQADFIARLPRNISLIELINLLELTKQVHFKLDNKTLTVMK